MGRWPYPVAMPNCLVIRAAGTNCDVELLRAFRLAGATTTLVHVDALVADPSPLARADLIAFPGGFSYGDDIASGRVFASKVRAHLETHLLAAVDRGACIIGVCNGFQVLVQLGLLPGASEHAIGQTKFAQQSVALVDNQAGRFVDRWVPITVDANSPCVWTRSWAKMSKGSNAAEVLQLPIAHAEGRLVGADAQVIQRLLDSGCAPVRYAENPNGSAGDIAGLCDPTGRIFGLMPHPERYLDWNRHPWATRLPGDMKKGHAPGLLFFQDAVAAVAQTANA